LEPEEGRKPGPIEVPDRAEFGALGRGLGPANRFLFLGGKHWSGHGGPGGSSAAGLALFTALSKSLQVFWFVSHINLVIEGILHPRIR
jgi:hypothetical protein